MNQEHNIIHHLATAIVNFGLWAVINVMTQLLFINVFIMNCYFGNITFEHHLTKLII